MDKIHLLCTALLPFLMLCCVATSFSDDPVDLAFKSNVIVDNDFPSDNGSIATSHSYWVGIPCRRCRRRVTALNPPAEEIEPKSKGGRLLISWNRKEECKNCHAMGRAEGFATPITKGEEAINAQEYREPVRAGHSSNPDHSDRGKNTGKPPL